MDTEILNHPDIDRIIQLSLDEDGFQNDITALAAKMNLGDLKPIRATIVAKAELVASGYPLVSKILKLGGIDQKVKVHSLMADGSVLQNKTPWMMFEGPSYDLLRAERTILNFLIRMSGIATYTRKIVEEIKHTETKILHTRKTAPGQRRTDIYAVLCGGGGAHRRSLDDAILVKENHLRSAKTFQDLVDGINQYRSQAKFVEIEVTNFVELKYALTAKPDRVLLDNFSVPDVAKAVNLFGSAVQLEASGNISLANVKAYAETGVDFISIGSLTHSAPAADLSMLFDHTNL